MSDRDPLKEVEELFDQLTQFTAPGAADIPVDIVDLDDELLVHADLPGRDPDQLDVLLTDDRKLQVEAGDRSEDTSGRYLTHERTRDSVSRTVQLPAAVDQTGTEATYDRGVLTVRLTKLTGDGDGTEIPVE
jgi:HSP20 family protein